MKQSTVDFHRYCAFIQFLFAPISRFRAISELLKWLRTLRDNFTHLLFQHWR